MANTYIQIYIQFVFAVRGRQNLIHPSKRELLQKYISGIIKNNNQKLLSIYANPDHVHLLIGFNSLNIRIPDLIRDIKSNSSKLSMKRIGSMENLTGRKVMVDFHIQRVKLIKSSIISIIRKSTIKRKVFGRNIWSF